MNSTIDRAESSPSPVQSPGRASFTISGGIVAAALAMVVELIVVKTFGLPHEISDFVPISFVACLFSFGGGIALAGRCLERYPDRADRLAPLLFLAAAVGAAVLVCGALVLLVVAAVSGITF